MVLEEKMGDWLRRELEHQKGNVSCLYRNLVTGDCFSYRADHVHPSASIIKMFLMANMGENDERTFDDFRWEQLAV